MRERGLKCLEPQERAIPAAGRSPCGITPGLLRILVEA